MSLPAVSRFVTSAGSFLSPFRALCFSPCYGLEQSHPQRRGRPAAALPARDPGTQTRHCRSSDDKVPPSDCFKMCIPRGEVLKSPEQVNHRANDVDCSSWKNSWDLQWWGHLDLDSEKTSFLQMQGCSELTHWHKFELFLKVCWVLIGSSVFRNISKIIYELIACYFLLFFSKFPFFD